MKIACKIANRINLFEPGIIFNYSQLPIGKNEFNAAAKAIERLIAKGKIERVTRGNFYRPEKSIFGKLIPDNSEILKCYLFENGKRIGYVTGTALYNQMLLTTQIPAIIDIASKKKRIYVSIGTVKAKPVKSYVAINNENYLLLGVLDALKDWRKIPDLDWVGGVIRLADIIANYNKTQLKNLVDYSLAYPPRVRALLGAIIEKNTTVKNKKLMESLNPFTKYNLIINETVLSTAKNWNIV